MSGTGTSRIPHQLLIHVDWVAGEPQDTLEVHYNYPFAGEHALPEQTIRLPFGSLPAPVRDDLRYFVDRLMSRIPPVPPARWPHAEVAVRLRPHNLTIVIQDATRTLPVVRLYYHEEAGPAGSPVERQIQMEAADCEQQDREVWRRLRSDFKRRAWEDYQRRVGTYVR